MSLADHHPASLLFSIHSSRKDCIPCLTSSTLNPFNSQEAGVRHCFLVKPLCQWTLFSLDISKPLCSPCWCPLPLFDFSVSLTLCLFSPAPYMLVSPGFPPRLIFSQASQLCELICAMTLGHPLCAGLESWHIWSPAQVFILNTRFRFPATYWPSLLGCLMGFQTQHVIDRTHHLLPQTFSSPFSLF